MIYDEKKSLFAFSQPRIKFFYNEIKNIKDIKILELGVAEGHSTSLFLKLIEQNGGKLISVDIKDSSHLFENHNWKFIHSSDHNFENINKEIQKLGQLDLILIDSFHEAMHVKKNLYNYYQFLKLNGLVVIDDISWLSYSKFSTKPSSGNFDANINTFNKLLEIKLNNKNNLSVEFCFEGSGSAKIIKKSFEKLNEPKKIKKPFYWKNFLLMIYRKIFK
tara:strand:+ start:583 stop:1239 length:657 start_codon:yes stop_codon:yes gene_type:complete